MHAETLCNEFKNAGISCDFAVSSRHDAQQVIQKYKDNEFDVLTNVQILTEGSDVPDIQTVFLTRETNSDSLLMQMIGRGLRGEKAGGTKVAHIVAFHDTWNTFAHWMDPGSLDIFPPEPPVDETLEENAELPVVAPDEEMLQLLKENAENYIPQDSEDLYTPINSEEIITSRDLYLKLYNLMKASLLSESTLPVYPCGWYSVVGEDGNDVQILVFDSQQRCYDELSRNIEYVQNKLTAKSLISIFFEKSDVKPDEKEASLLLEYIEEEGAMPPYFEFAQRIALDPKVIAETVNKMFEKLEDKEEWLKQLFNNTPILQQIYRYFYAFKKTVFDAMKPESKAIIETVDDRSDYEFIENYYNLSELLEEVKAMFPLLRTDGLVKISWSHDFVNNWCALCQRFWFDDDFVYQIHINKLLSSPKIDREVIKYLIFHELLHQNGYWDHDEEFRARERQYPNSAELDGILDSLRLEYKIEELDGEFVRYEEPEFSPEPVVKDKISETEDTSTFNPNAKGVSKGYKYCRNCGNKLPESAVFCDKCGHSVVY